MTEGQYNSTAITLTDTQTALPQMDSSGNIKVTNATLSAGEDITNDVLKVEQRNSYYRIRNLATNTIKSGAGFLHAVTIGSAACGGIVHMYDSTTATGTPIGSISLVGVSAGNARPFTLSFDVSFSTGLTLKTALRTQSIVVSYR